MTETESRIHHRFLTPSRLVWGIVVGLCLAHGVLSWMSFGGWSELSSSWPMAIDDQSIQEHNAWISSSFLKRSGTNAGYDPYFMSGYAKSLFSSPSSTLFEVIAFLTGPLDQAVVYKVTLLVILASLPWLVAAAGILMGLGEGTTLSGVILFLLYVWTDGGGGGFPLNYAGLGMNAYLHSVPFGLVVIAGFVNYLKLGGRWRWVFVLGLASFALMEHVTSVMFLGPAAIAAYVAASWRGQGFPAKRHWGVAGLAIGILLLNSFWWAPALALRSTRAPGGNFFVNNEPVLGRLAKIVVSEPPPQAVILGFTFLGLVSLWKRDRLLAAGLSGFAVAGLGWGYLAGAYEQLNFLQPGRQTYALYAVCCLFAGEGLRFLVATLGRESRAAKIAMVLGLLMIGGRIFGGFLDQSVRFRLGLMPQLLDRPFLSSQPPPGFKRILQWVRANMKPGERLFYEEVGMAVPGEPDPFAGGRYSGLLPRLTGIEVVGGFYLHVGLTTNFSQIGEGKFFGGAWDRERFLRFAKMYRPAALLCWSREARAFCLANPDLFEVSLDQGRLLAVRVRGFEGETIRGYAEVKAEPGVLRVSNIEPDLDGLVVLRYHSVPGLRTQPPMRMEPVFLKEDPVPFIGLRPLAGQTDTVLDLAVPPGR